MRTLYFTEYLNESSEWMGGGGEAGVRGAAGERERKRGRLEKAFTLHEREKHELGLTELERGRLWESKGKIMRMRVTENK